MRVHVGLFLAIESLGLLMHGVERLDGVVNGGDAVAELVERVLLTLHGGLGAGGTNSLKALSDLGGIGSNDRAIGTTRLANHRGGLDVHELVVLLELAVVAALGLGLGQDTRLFKERDGLIGNKGGQGVGRSLVVGKAALLGLDGPLIGVAIAGEENTLVVGQDLLAVLERGVLDLGADTLPKLMQDNTDRNRTSPFAFTGNKFEFRMLGSSQSVASPNTVLNTIMAEELGQFADILEQAEDFNTALQTLLHDTFKAHQRIIFNGNGYSEEWEKEAEKRGLANHRNTAEALPCFVDQKSLDLFNEFNVLTEPEARSRYEVKLDKYNKLLNIEARTMIRMVRRAYLPAITDYMADLASNITTVKAAISGADMTEAESVLEVIIAGADKAAKATRELIKVHNAAEAIEAPQEQANAYANEVIPAMDALRAEIDALECVVERDYWPVPTYNDILFYA